MKDITERFFEGDRRALARVLSRIESGNPTGREYMRELYPRSGNAHTIGITGGAGSGKSTLTGALAAEYRKRNFKVGIVAVDPSSPFSQGAILGDRIRMQSLILDPGVFVRSMASRGTLGGLAPTIDDVIAAMDAFGFEYILVETVGAGQDEVEIAGSALTTILVNNPGTGDDIQAMKAGLMETPDIFVVNKSDRPGSDKVELYIKSMINDNLNKVERKPVVVKTSYNDSSSMESLYQEIILFWKWQKKGNFLEKNKKERYKTIVKNNLINIARLEASIL